MEGAIMTRSKPKIQKRLAKLVLATLLFTGGAQLAISPSVVEASWNEITTDTTIGADETATYTDGVKMNASNIALTITSNGKVKMIESADYNNNTITVQGKVINHTVTAIWGGATGNKVYIKTGAEVQGEIYAGCHPTIDVSGNELIISGGAIEGNIFGGVNKNGTTAYDVKNNTVTISGGTINGIVKGGQTTEKGNTKNNTVTITGGSITDSVTGGFAYLGNATLNTVNISGSATAITGAVTGGLSMNSDATENKVAINGGNFGSYVTGGHTTNGKNATDNTVTIEGGTITGNIYGGLSENGTAGAANDNTVTISGGTANGGVYGGKAKGDASNNTVTISGGTINKQVFGGNSAAGDANNNTITVSGGTIKDDIMGGYSTDHKADDNTVTISGSPEISSSAQIWGGNARTSASNNTVNILSPITVSLIQGGYVANADGQITGNTLNIAAKGVTTGAVKGFQNMNFFLPADIANNDTMLTVNGGSATDMKGVTFGVAALSGVKLVKGDTVNLITNPSGLTTDDTLNTTDSATLAKAAFLSANSLTTDDAYELSISKKDANTIIAKVDNVTEKKAPEEAVDDIKKSPVETRAGVVTLLNAGTDMLVGQGMANAADAAAAERSGNNAAAAPRAGGFAPFAAVGLGNLRAKSGVSV